MSILQPGTLPVYLLLPCKLKLGSVGLCQNHAVDREFDLINSPGERRLDLHSVAIEDISPAGVPDQDSPISREFPNHCVCILRHAPFTNDIVRRTPAAGHST